MPWVDTIDPDRTLKRFKVSEALAALEGVDLPNASPPSSRPPSSQLAAPSRPPPSRPPTPGALRPLPVPARARAPRADATEEILAEDVLESVASVRLPPPPATPSPAARTAAAAVAALPRNAESTQELSPSDILDVRVLGRRVFPNPRIVEVGEPSIPIVVEEAPPPSSRPSAPPPSIAPVSFDAPVATAPAHREQVDSTFHIDDNPFRPKRPRAMVIGGAIGALATGLVLAFALGSAGAKSTSRDAVINAAAKSAPAVTAAAQARPREGSSQREAVAAAAAPVKVASSGVPTVDVASLPRVPVGTVSLASTASSHRLFIDGAVAARSSTVVTCGNHTVRVGSKGRAQSIDVPCGGEVVVR